MNRISNDELLYHHKVMQIKADALASYRFWVSHLSQKYNLTDDDIINLDGSIVRPSAAKLPPQS